MKNTLKNYEEENFDGQITVGNKRIIICNNKPYKNENELLAILAENRNITNLSEFISINISNSIPDPYIFKDMQRACEKTLEAIKNKKSIAILGDYDVDGISSTAILVKFFNYLKIKNYYFIPNRLDEGYGVSIKNLEKYKDSFIITVDTGSSAFCELEYAKNNNIDMIVLDHHDMHLIPEGFPIVNPHRPDENDDFKYLCAAGVVFLFVVGVNRLLRENGFYKDLREPNLIELTDLVALATIADVVDIKGLNRAFVGTGLKIISQLKNTGLAALLSLADGRKINSELIAYWIGPRINAAGRLETGEIAARMLTTTDPLDAKALALKLDGLNRSRQEIEALMSEEAHAMVTPEDNFICVYKEDWHIGIIGILAGRLKEKYNKPTIVLAKAKDGMARASCRSITNVNISLLIQEAIDQKIITSGGGHALAAGFSMEISKIPDLKEFLKTKLTTKNPLPEILIDTVLNTDILSSNLIERISVLEPFGAANARPKFLIPNIWPQGTKILAEKHIQFSIPYKNSELRAICFNAVGGALEKHLLNPKGPISCIGELSINTFRGIDYLNFSVSDIQG